MPPLDPDHWLYRLSAPDWLRAAENELELARAALAAKRQREGVTYARRAGGMALNALLVEHEDPAYGRSYMDHLRALQEDAAVPAEVRSSARALLAAPMRLDVVPLGPGSTDLATHAARVAAYARALVDTRSA
jgi:HEPN domain-containing protein